MQHHVTPAVIRGQAAQVGSLPAEQRLNVTIVLPLRNQSELTGLLGRLYDPSSPDYRHFLSVEQFTEEFAPTVEDYQAVVDFAKANGLTITSSPSNRLIVPISGSVAKIEKAFNVRMKVYRHPTENRTFYSPDREPSFNLRVHVAHITGLNNYSLPHPMVTKAAEGAPISEAAGTGPRRFYLGSDMRAAYYTSTLPAGATALTGIGQTVGLLEFDGYNLSDVNSTFSNVGQSYSVPINNVLLDGATGAAVYQDDSEQVLDIVQAIGMAPALSQVRVYIGGSDVDIFNAMATENIAKQLSISWAWYPDDPSTDDAFFQEFAAQGQSVFVASGDSGAFDTAISPYYYPAEDALVTSVGATHLTTDDSSGGWVFESAWNTNEHGSGGGTSPDGILIPSWQAGVANSSNGGSTTLRNEPDVAMEGDYDNYVCDMGGCAGGWAGTSFAAPRWAGFMALVNQQAQETGNAPLGGLGFVNPAIYSLGASSSYGNDFHDAASGNNQTDGQSLWYNAVTGYDLVTGWGSPTGQSLIDSLAGQQVPGFWISNSSGGVLSINQGSSSTSIITVTDAGGFTGSVTLAASGLPSGVTASFSPNPTTGSSVLTLRATSAIPTQNYVAAIIGNSAAQTVSTALSVSVVPAPATATTTALSINPAGGTLTTGTVYTLTAAVAPASGSTTPTGSVVFAIGLATQTVALNPLGIATYTGTAPATAGSLALSVAYQGTAAFSASASSTLNETVISPTPAILTTPASGGILPGPNVTFAWTAGQAVTSYQLNLGTLGVGTSDLYNSGHINALSVNVTGLATYGQTVYARLYSQIKGVWISVDYTYTEAGSPLPAVLSSPAQGGVLPGSSVVFTWSRGGGIKAYQLDLGTLGVGSSNLYNSGHTTALSVNVAGLPTYGQTIYARLYSDANSGVWQSVDFTFTEAGAPVLAALCTPAPGSVLAGSSATFTWTAGGGVASYQLILGTTGVGSYNLYSSGHTTATSASVTGLPTNGAKIYARLYSDAAGIWKYVDYTYIEGGSPVPAALMTPSPGSVLPGSSATFTWTAGGGVVSYQLILGTTGVGSYNLYNSGHTTATSASVTGLPTNGAKIYARLYSDIAGTWSSVDYIYTAQ